MLLSTEPTQKSCLMETSLVSGKRFAAVRLDRYENQHFIDTMTIAYSHEGAIQLAGDADRDLGSEYCETAPVVGVIEFDLIVNQIYWGE